MKKVHHIAIAVREIEAALPFWRDALGLELAEIEEVGPQNARVAFLPVGESRIELVQPTEMESPIGRFLEKRGGGLHHFCIQVEDILASLAQLRQHGVTLIDETPRRRENGTQYAFIHPESTGGVLVELYQLP